MTIVVVGAGLAGGKAVEELRSQGYDGPLVLFGEEQHLPYERPPLSKSYLLGNDPIESAFVHDRAWYDGHDVDVRAGRAVTAVDPGRKVVLTAEGEQAYDKLLLATGASPRRLPPADASGAPVAYLRTIEDSDRLKATFKPGARVTVIGAGWIGLEVASAARAADADVTVVEMLTLPLVRVLGPEVAAVFADLHRSHGVDLRLDTNVAAIGSDGELTLGDGSSVVAPDLLVVGIGVAPNIELADKAGLAVDNGVLVDRHLATSDADVYAAGDIANHQHPVLGRRIRVEHWDTAIEQGRTAARNMLGAGETYDRLPYFFTDQYDLGMEYVGSPDGYDTVVVRGRPEEQLFTAFWLRDDRVLAGMHVNDWDAIDPIRDLVGRKVDVDRLRDESVALGEV
jgi:3-phenylpropionate/trans-cinnamate dioxygenase ferredoxin reductase component